MGKLILRLYFSDASPTCPKDGSILNEKEVSHFYNAYIYIYIYIYRFISLILIMKINNRSIISQHNDCHQLNKVRPVR